MTDAPLPAFFADYRDPLGEDRRPFELLTALHTWRGMAPTVHLAFAWSEHIGDGFVFHMNGSHRETRMCRAETGGATACLPRHLLVFRHGEPVLLINATGGWGQPADRDAFCDRLAIFLETLKGEAA